MKLGMLGMWHAHADGIVRRVVENPKEFSLVGFYDPDPAVVEARRKEWGPRVDGFRVFERAEQLLAEPVDGIVVEGRVYENLKLARMALEAGRPVLLEKPAGERLAEFKELADLAQKKHLHLQMTYLFRYMSAVQEMLKRAASGGLGEVYEFRARLPKDLPSYARNAQEVGRYKGGMFFEMAGHVIDMMITILGPPKSVAPFMAHHHTAPPEDFIDNGVAVFGFERAWGIIEVPALEVAPRNRRIEVYGTKGACVIPHLGSGHLTNKDIQPIETYQVGESDWQTHNLPAATLQIADLREFAAVVRRKKKPNYTLEHDLAVQEALLRASGMN
jgi:predicted dehydrogenase